jgi:hypothetical protein
MTNTSPLIPTKGKLPMLHQIVVCILFAKVDTYDKLPPKIRFVALFMCVHHLYASNLCVKFWILVLGRPQKFFEIWRPSCKPIHQQDVYTLMLEIIPKPHLHAGCKFQIWRPSCKPIHQQVGDSMMSIPWWKKLFKNSIYMQFITKLIIPIVFSSALSGRRKRILF